MEGSEDLPAVALRGVRKSFGRQQVLKGIDLTVKQGETMAVLGKSGTGKSVLLKLIIGLQQPDAGSIQVHGQEITGLPQRQLNEIRKKMGFLFQDGALYDSLTIGENVEFPLQRHTRLSAAERKNRALELLSLVGMADSPHKLPSQISGGMKKRVSLARALALDPDIVLFDEPTSGLDPITAAEIEELILELRRERKMAAIVVTHDLHGARTISRHLALINEGNLLIEGTFEDLQKSQDGFVTRFLKQAC